MSHRTYPGRVAESESIISTCRELAKGFAGRAAKYDREGSFPVENFDEIKAAGLLGIMVPKDKGGMGADFLTYTMALEQLAMGDSSTALTYNMHNIAAGSMSEIQAAGLKGSAGRRMNKFLDWAYGEMLDGKKVFASANSEPGIGAHFGSLKTTYKHVDGGYLINGKKIFVSMAGYADYYVVAARKADSESELPELSFFVVGLEADGIRIDRIWDVLGMRATVSDNMTFEDVFVPQDRLFLGMEGLGIYKITREPHWVIGGYIGVYLGICSAAFEYMVEELKRKKIPGTDKSVIHRDWVQREVGELAVGLESVRAVVYDAAIQVQEQRGAPETNLAIHRSKYAVSEFAPHLASNAIRMCGGRSITKKAPLERLYRDARCGGLMPATSDECLLYVGKAALGFDMSKLEETYW